MFALASLIHLYKSNFTSLIYWSCATTAITIIVIWQTFGIWRSANRYTEEKGRYFWAGLAKLMVIMSILNLAAEYQKTLIPALKESYQQAIWLSDVQWNIHLSADGQEIEISGGINHGISDDFETILNAAANVKIVHVNLYEGGLIEEALKLQQIIREKQLTTYVSTECVSACTLVFLGGEHRLLRKYARIGFHAYSAPGINKDDIFFFDAKRDLINLGLTKDFVEKIFKTPKEQMWFPNTNELLSANVIHQVVEGDEFLIQGAGSNSTMRAFKEIDSKLKEIENAETVQDTIDAIKRSEETMGNGIVDLSSRAKSPASFKFIEYSEKQNELAEKGQTLLLQFSDIEKVLEGIDPNTENENELKVLYSQLEMICKLEREFIPLVSEMVDIIDKKIELANDPNVFKELFDSDFRVHQLLLTLRENQNNVLLSEIATYQELYCDSILSPN